MAAEAPVGALGGDVAGGLLLPVAVLRRVVHQRQRQRGRRRALPRRTGFNEIHRTIFFGQKTRSIVFTSPRRPQKRRHDEHSAAAVVHDDGLLLEQ